eukprot:747348-Pyramimonas_sp.AAC.1
MYLELSTASPLTFSARSSPLLERRCALSLKLLWHELKLPLPVARAVSDHLIPTFQGAPAGAHCHHLHPMLSPEPCRVRVLPLVFQLPVALL